MMTAGEALERIEGVTSKADIGIAVLNAWYEGHSEGYKEAKRIFGQVFDKKEEDEEELGNGGEPRPNLPEDDWRETR